MARSEQITVGPTVKVLLAGSTKAGGGMVWITLPTGQPVAVYIGGEGQELPQVTSGTLTSQTGYTLAIGSSIGPINLAGNEALYGITNTNTVVVGVFRASGAK